MCFKETNVDIDLDWAVSWASVRTPWTSFEAYVWDGGVMTPILPEGISDPFDHQELTTLGVTAGKRSSVRGPLFFWGSMVVRGARPLDLRSFLHYRGFYHGKLDGEAETFLRRI